MKHGGKPAGWGTLGRPAGTGSRRVQFVLTAGDRARLHFLRRRLGCSRAAVAAREAIRAQAAREREPGAARLWEAEAAACRLPPGRPGAGRLTGRWSQWVTEEDRMNLRFLVGRRGLRSLSEAFRFALLCEETAGRRRGPV